MAPNKGKRKAPVAVVVVSSSDDEKDSNSDVEDGVASSDEVDSNSDVEDGLASGDEDDEDSCSDSDGDDCDEVSDDDDYVGEPEETTPSESDEDGGRGDPPDDEARSRAVVDLLKCKKSLKSLKLEDCKAYLRKHELRLSGDKEKCIERILQHWRIKDGEGQKLYPQSSFVINCTGDVCNGDVICFKQRVYEKFDIVKRGGRGNIIGKRIVAGRVVKESYGAAKQQHTFTVEVLWCRGVQVLPPLRPLLVKGRNLYRLKTFRQRWSNENERSKVLAEKHKRGAAARHVRATRKAISENKGSKHPKNSIKRVAPSGKRQKKDIMPAKDDTMRNNGHDMHNGRAAAAVITKPRNEGLPRTFASHPNSGYFRRHHCDYSVPANNHYPSHIESHQINRTAFSANREIDHSVPANNHYPNHIESHQINRAAYSANREIDHLQRYNGIYHRAPLTVLPAHVNQINNQINYPYSGSTAYAFDRNASRHVAREMEFGKCPMPHPRYQNHRNRWP